MRRVPGHLLWLGHIGDIRDLRGVLSTGIRAVVDLAINEPPAIVTRELVYCRFPLLDGAGNAPWLIRTAVDVVADLLRSRIPTLIYCSAGMSRTPAIAAAAIAVAEGCKFADALTLVTESAAADVSAALWSEVQAVLNSPPLSPD
jgi:protein-tyrosine phosphatase